MRLTNRNGIPIYNLIEEQPYSKSKEYGEMVLRDPQFNIIPHYSSFSMMDLLPVLNGEEGDLIDLITGKPVDGLQSKQKMMYNHSARDMQMFALNRVLLQDIDNDDNNFTREIIRILTKTGLYNKLLCLRILVYIYFGHVDDDKKDLNEIISDIDDIRTTPIFNAALRVDVIPQSVGLIKYYEDDFNYIKSNFNLNVNVNEISTNIYSNGLLIKCYKDITDDDIKSFMNLFANDKKKYNLIYSEKNKETYDNIRYLLINASIISSTLTQRAKYGVAAVRPLANPGLAAVANPGLAAANPLVNREAEARHAAITAIIAAMENNRRAPGPGAAPGPGPGAAPAPAPIQNENVAIIAALAAMENNRPNPGPGPPAINNAALAAMIAANP